MTKTMKAYSSLSPINIDSTLMNTSSNSNMMQTATSHQEQSQSTNDDIYPASSIFSQSFTNSMLDNEHPWMILQFKSKHKRLPSNFVHNQQRELKKEFHYAKYLTCKRAIEIARSLLLTEQQVKNWFSSCRCRWRPDTSKSRNDPHANLEVNATDHGQNHHSYAILTNNTS